MNTITTVLAFIVTLSILIVIHEYGHYRVALACGVKVLRFSVGFGRVIYRFPQKPGRAEFVISALPFGGYVRMLGHGEGPVPAQDRDVAFDCKPLWKRAAIVGAGPAANLLLAVLLYAGAHWIGVDDPLARLASPPAASLAAEAGVRAGEVVQAVSYDGADWHEVRSSSDLRWHLMQAVTDGKALELRVSDPQGARRRTLRLDLDRLPTRELDAAALQRIGVGAPFIEPVVAGLAAGSAASRAGLRQGDRILSVDGQAVTDAQRVRELIRASASEGGAPRVQRWHVERGGQTVELEVQAVIEDDGRGQKTPRIGVMFPQPENVTVRYGVWEGFAKAAVKTWDMSIFTLRMMGRMLIGEASLKNISGPLTIADYAGQTARLGFVYYLGFLAAVSVSLGVLNLLPLPVLDGGHLMYYLFEAVTGRPPSDVWLERLQMGGMAVVFMMMSLALYNDLARYLGLH
jgi:regulator of sigma E protease